jgi:hypothetical protein
VKRVIIAVAAVLTLAGCGSSPGGGNEVQGPSVKAFLVPTPDGREVVCVWAEGYNRAGLSCDWGNK